MLSRIPKSILVALICTASVLSFAVLADIFTESTPFAGSTFTMPSIKLSSRSPASQIVSVPSRPFRMLRLRAEEAIYLNGEVGPQIDLIVSQLDRLNYDSDVKAIYLLINSPGGSVSEGIKLVSAIESSKKPVVTVCLELCASMAAIIHQYGHQRMMINRSTLMFHDAAGGVRGTIPQMRSRLDYWDRITTKMDAQIAARAGVDLQTFLIALRSEIWIDAEDSTAQHFNDEIIYISIAGGLTPTLIESPSQERRDDDSSKLTKPLVNDV